MLINAIDGTRSFLVSIELAATIPQACCRLLRGNIALRLSHELKADKELAHRRGAQQRRIKVHVKVRILNFVLRAAQRRLVDAGAVGEAALKQVVVAARHLLQRLCKLEALIGGKVDEGADMTLGEDEDLKGPDGPPGADDKEGVVLPDDALILLHLQLDVVGQQVAAVLRLVLGHLHELLAGLLGHGRGSPHLAVGVRIRAAHGGALVFEYLHVAVLVLGDRGVFPREGQVELVRDRRERVRGRQVVGIDARPVLNGGQDVGAGHVGERQVVLWRECEDVADALDALSAEEKRAGICNVELAFFSSGMQCDNRGALTI